MDIHMISDKERHNLFSEHPVITKKYLIITPVITNIYSIIRDRVWMRSTGTFMYATPRMGKTTCARAIKILLEAEFPEICVISFSAEAKRKQEAAMLIDIIQSESLAAVKPPRYKDIQRQLITHIQSKLVTKKGQQFVLMIDEMQKLGEEDLDMLATIHNRLEAIGIKMTTLGFGQPEILDLRTSLQTTSRNFLIARFLSEPIAFDGCTTKSDLKVILESYDNIQYFPVDSDFTFTRFFLPYAFDNGFRMSSYSDDIWSALVIAAKQLTADSIPMEHLSRTIEYLLVKGSKSDSPKFTFKKNDISSAVKASNLNYFFGLFDNQ